MTKITSTLQKSSMAIPIKNLSNLFIPEKQLGLFPKEKAKRKKINK